MGRLSQGNEQRSARETGWRRVAILSCLLWAVVVALWLRDRLEERGRVDLPIAVRTAPDEDRLAVLPDRFDRLPQWRDDRLSEALVALRRSCQATLELPRAELLGGGGFAGTAGDWRPACEALSSLADDSSDETLRGFLEERFRPWKVLNGDRRIGLFTGYYEPLLRGSRRRQGAYDVPLYELPADLVSIDLGRYRSDLAGRRIGARRRGRQLEPYPDRAGIDNGALSGRGLEILWVDDPVDAFFLHIQGSGRVELAEGGVMRVGFAGQNGQPYFAIGRELIARGAIAREEISMQSIRRWLSENPEEASAVMAMNRSYVFFRDLGKEGPVGAQGVVLTPGRSLAVDRRYLPLGAPVWLESRLPGSDGGERDETRRWLLVTQDTGGAIRGPVRGDVFWGAGDEAAEVAGRMRHRGRIWILLPREIEVPQAAG